VPWDVLERLRARLRRALARRAGLAVWHHADYRLPSASVEGRVGIEPRRAELVLWSLRAAGVVRERDVRVPERVSYADLARVHTADYLQSLHDPATLARIFAADPEALVVDELLEHARVACGATVAAARHALASRGPALNLLGGFHHAGPAHGGGLCAVNDIAVAIAVLRAEGFAGQVVTIDLDAHPPDGTAECLAGDPRAWIGSLSGSSWGPLAGAVHETVLPRDTGDAAYLDALEILLARAPAPELAFVIAGGDVLAGDRLGNLGLTLDGARRRDRRVARFLEGVPSVWLPGGGYHPDSWKLLAGTALVLAGRGEDRVRAGDPLEQRFAAIASGLDRGRLAATSDDVLTLEDIEADLDGRTRVRRLLGFYGSAGIEYGLSRYGILEHLGRLGYSGFRIAVDGADVGDRARVYGRAGGAEHLLIEVVLERRRIGDREMVFVHWLNLRNPRGSPRDLLPGQDVPGLGIAREMAELFERIAARLGLAGVAFRPSHYHLAYAARSRFRFLDPARQGRFEALLRDLAGVPLPEATRLVEEGRVLLDGQPYRWEADEMVDLLASAGDDAEAVAAAREAARFTL
jgi:acetoin utilization deacetylase AcuC-like enzyme